MPREQPVVVLTRPCRALLMLRRQFICHSKTLAPCSHTNYSASSVSWKRTRWSKPHRRTCRASSGRARDCSSEINITTRFQIMGFKATRPAAKMAQAEMTCSTSLESSVKACHSRGCRARLARYYPLQRLTLSKSTQLD